MTFTWVLDERKFLPLEQVRRIRAFCQRRKREALKSGEFLPIREWFMVELGLNTGLRVQEIADLKCGDLFISALEGSVIVRKGKGRKRRPVWISEPFKKDCQFFLRWKHHLGYSVENEAAVFTSEHGRPVTKRTLQESFKSIARDAGLPAYYSIHCLRHTYATHLLKASGNNFKLIKEQLGHSSIEVSEIYAGLIGSEVKKALGKMYS